MSLSTLPTQLIEPPFYGFVQPQLSVGADHIGNAVTDSADIDQTIKLILMTPKGSDPLRPTFACDLWRHLDKPINIARALIIREATEALWEWEPRIDVVRITCLGDGGADLSGLVLTIEWKFTNESEGFVTTLNLDAERALQ